MIYYLTAYLYMALLALGALFALRGSGAMKRTMYTVIANYALAFAYTWNTRDSDPWAVFMALDFISAAIILIRPAGPAQGLVGALYLVQIIFHAAYAWALPNVNAFMYWWLLTGVAFLQLFVIGGWMLHERGYRYRLPHRLGRLFAPAHSTSVEG